MHYTTKEVYFDVYCKSCKYQKLKEDKDPCNTCLSQGWNENTHKPIKYEATEDRLIKEAKVRRWWQRRKK